MKAMLLACLATVMPGFLAAHLAAHEWHREDGAGVALLRPMSDAERAILDAADAGFVAETAEPAAAEARAAEVGPVGAGDSDVALGRLAPAFARFAPGVRTRADGRWFLVESDGLPVHNMMVGITAWQQQVPLPQPYAGGNAWRIPLHPVPARNPQSIRGRFLRGAIALAVNGVPIFNPQNNRGEISAEIGELDEWGGHCGRADDYHYHAAPLHLQAVLGTSLPVAFALDGYPIYGLTEPDGSKPVRLDAFNGHETAGLGYHYHGSTRYPYVNGGFHGEVFEAGGQVDPQPRAQPVRPDLPPLRGARITGFGRTRDARGQPGYSLNYAVNGRPGSVTWVTQGEGEWRFRFTGTDGTVREETYRAGEGRGAGGSGGRPRRDRRDGGGDAGPGAGAGGEARPLAREVGPGEGGSRTAAGGFELRSPEVAEGGELPVEFTGDGAGATLPLVWDGAPAGTRSFALAMHHVDPEGRVKSYWTLYNIPADVTRLPKNATGVGIMGNNGINGRVGYAPPRSKGPGPKTYVLTLYALSEILDPGRAPAEVSRDILLGAMRQRVLATAELRVVSTRGERGALDGRTPRQSVGDEQGQRAGLGGGRDAEPARPGIRGGVDGGGRGADRAGLIKPTLGDVIKANVYADNWFVMYINGRLRAVDSIEFTPHNVVTVDLLPEYPMTIAILAKDNADPRTGLEYGDRIGDGGFILKFADGTVTDATWKAKSFFRGPMGGPRGTTVAHTPVPTNWFAVDFDDTSWGQAVEHSEQRVNPKEAFHAADFTGAKFIWTGDLDLDNTVIFRKRVERPGWKPRWNTRPDLDVSGPPWR